MSDFGIKKQFSNGELSLSTFYALHDNVLSSVYNSDFKANILQNVGEAEVYGINLISSFEPFDNFLLFFNPSIQKSSIKNTLVYQNKLFDIKNNTIPETPKVIVKSGAIYHHDSFSHSIMLKTVGSQFGDIENNQKVKGYTNIDTRHEYSFKTIFSNS
ncbi:MAG: TonB-dependent receptor [Campylobacterales bacterium]|nr:TonB-dependent receptor [Campylobacterales bacterium]